MHLCVAGGAGYVGSKLVPKLLELGHQVTVLDLFLYGDTLGENPRLRKIKADIRDIEAVKKSVEGCDMVIHLACISNDPSFELNPKLGKEINLDAFEPFVVAAKEAGVKRFIYASSSSVYGIKDSDNVTEEMTLEPLTDYSKFKAECEKILFRFMDDSFVCTVIRPATVCGYAPRQRLDLVVNILTNLAYHKGLVKVMGGEQLRPNIHIDDMVRAYVHLVEASREKVQGEIFNAGYHNHSVMELGKLAAKVVGEKRDVSLEVIPTDDNRSYHVSSEKIAKKLGFKAQYSIEDAMRDLVKAFDTKELVDTLEDEKFFNIKTMKAVNLA